MICAALTFFSAPALAETWQCDNGGKCRVEMQNKGQVRFTLPNGISLQCREFRLRGQVEGRKRDLQLKINKIRKCTAQVAGKRVEVIVTPSECEIRFTIVKQEEIEKKQQAQGVVSIKKEPKSACQITIKIPATGCELRINERTNKELKGFRARQVGGKGKTREIQIKVVELPLQYKTNSKPVACGEEKETGRAKFTGTGRLTSPEGIKLRP